MRSLVLLLVMSVAAFGAESIKLRADSWMPYNGDPKDAKPGFSLEIARAALEPQGVTIDYQIMPWARALKELESGSIDAVIGSLGDEVPGMFVPVESVGQTTTEAIVLAGNSWTYSGITSLDTVKVGFPRGYTYAEDIDKYLAANAKKNVMEVGGDDPLVQARALLERKRVDAFIEGEQVFMWGLTPEQKALYKVGGTVVPAKDIFVAFSPKAANGKRWADLLGKGIADLRASGKLKEILAKYGLTDWKK
jgi:polar amino acid transport system substrate-binding protein